MNERTGRLLAGVILIIMGIVCGLAVVAGTIVILELDRNVPGPSDPSFLIFVLIGLALAAGLIWAGAKVLAAVGRSDVPPTASVDNRPNGPVAGSPAASPASASAMVGCISVVGGLLFMATGGMCAFFGITSQTGWSVLVGGAMLAGGFIVMRYGR